MKRFLRHLLCLLGLGAAAASAQQADGYQSVDVATFNRLIATDPQAYLLDVRTPQEFADGHIAGAHNIDWLDQATFRAEAPQLPTDKHIYVYCRSGKRSAAASEFLTKLGYRVTNLTGGYIAWHQQQ